MGSRAKLLKNLTTCSIHFHVQEKGKFPSQTQQNPRGAHEIASASEPTPKIDEVKVVITLRSGKQVKQPMPQPLEEAKEEKDELGAMPQVEQPTILVNIGRTCVEKALLDLGASVNLLPYSVYKQLGLGELKPTTITMSLADRSIKIPKGIVEDVLMQVDRFYYPLNFIVLDIQPVVVGANYVPIILGRPFLATSNAIINFRNGVIQLTFGNMTLELNIFHLSKKHMHPVEEDPKEVCLIDTILDE